jgi:hypothetical protein
MLYTVYFILRTARQDICWFFFPFDQSFSQARVQYQRLLFNAAHNFINDEPVAIDPVQ